MFFRKLRESVESDMDVLYRSYVTLWKEAQEFFRKLTRVFRKRRGSF
jgi:hypothetical protein